MLDCEPIVINDLLTRLKEGVQRRLPLGIGHLTPQQLKGKGHLSAARQAHDKLIGSRPPIELGDAVQGVVVGVERLKAFVGHLQLVAINADLSVDCGVTRERRVFDGADTDTHCFGGTGYRAAGPLQFLR